MRKITLCNDFVELLLGCYKKVHIETYSLSKKKENLVMLCIARKKTPVSLFDQNRTQDNIKSHIQHEKIWLR